MAEQDLEIEQIVKRLDMLNHRLDSMDSVITSLVERVMGRLLTMEVTCPKCAELVRDGRLAQWLERCVDIAEVTGSSPVSPIVVDRQGRFT